MSMIRGKLEGDREVAPMFVVVGESDFSKSDTSPNGWVLAESPDVRVNVEILDKAFFEVATAAGE